MFERSQSLKIPTKTKVAQSVTSNLIASVAKEHKEKALEYKQIYTPISERFLVHNQDDLILKDKILSIEC